MTDDQKISFLENHPELQELPYVRPVDFRKYPEVFHFVDINDDKKLDVIQLYEHTEYGEHDDMISILVSNGDKYERVFKMVGNVVDVTRRTNRSPLNIVILHCISSGQLKYAYNYFEIRKNKETNLVSISFESAIFYPDKFIFPEKQTMNVLFKVTNDKYRLRSSPQIDTVTIKPPYELGNLIAEFKEGDFGYALAEKTDETGRVWWFVLMENNVKKDWTKLMHIENENDKYKRRRVFGWMSSRYLEKVK